MLKILLVDDYDETLESLALIYSLYPDVEIVGSAHNSDELWGVLDTSQVDLVSLDIQLGHENGLELCEYIHQKYPDIYIVMCSLEAHDTYLRVAERVGASMFLAKPVSKNDIANVITECRKSKIQSSKSVLMNQDWVDDLLGSL